MNKNVFIIGSRGYKKNYGGWETFVDNLVKDGELFSTQFHVYEINSESNGLIIKDSVYCHQIKQKNFGNITMVFFAAKATLHALKYAKKNKINHPILYILGLRIGPLFWILKKLKKLANIKIIINPDGLEWKRAKWNRIVRFYFKISERTMIKSSDYIICDSKGILEYIQAKYQVSSKSKFIPYGYTVEKYISDNRLDSYYEKYNLKKNEYFLIVGRFVPENNFELIIRGFIESNSKKKLLIISNFKPTDKLFIKLTRNFNFELDKRIIFSEPVYDKSILNTIRHNAFVYIHGHSVGGTNPSLLESLGNTDINFVYDVVFNKEVLGNFGFYFSSSSELTRLIDSSDKITIETRKRYNNECMIILQKNYNWNIVQIDHNEVFNTLLK